MKLLVGISSLGISIKERGRFLTWKTRANAPVCFFHFQLYLRAARKSMSFDWDLYWDLIGILLGFSAFTSFLL
jgi:hypothetical protein